MMRTSRGRVPSSDVGRIHTIRRSRTRTLTPFRRDGLAPSATAASRHTMGRSAAIERRDALGALEGSGRFDHDGLAVRSARNCDGFRTAGRAHGDVPPQNPQGIKGPTAIRASLGPFLKAFPDIRFATETQFGAGDWVTQLGHVRGTNAGPLEMPGAPTIPATNKPVRLPVAMIAKLEGGKFAEINLYFDQASMLTQLGLTPQGPPQRKP